jgi:hypothetical protein
MFVINFNDKTVAEFNEQELSRLLNRFFGKPSTRQWLFAHDKKTATKIIKFALKKKGKVNV